MSLGVVDEAGVPAVEQQTPPAQPAVPRPWGFWATLGWLLLAVGAGIGAAFVFLGSVPAELLEFGPAEFTPVSELANYAALTGIVLVLAIAARVAGWSITDYFALHRPNWRAVAFGLAIIAAWSALGLVLLYALGIGETDSKFLVEAYRSARASSAVPLLWVTAVVAAPLAEEAVFRGFVYRGWSHTRLGVVLTVLVTSVAFGLLHTQYTWLGVLDCTVFGLFAGYMRWRSGTLTVPILLHFANNVIAMLYAMSQA